MSGEVWEFIYRIDGLPVPRKKYVMDNIMIRGIRPEDRYAEGRVRLPVKHKEEEIMIVPQEVRNALTRFLSYYVLGASFFDRPVFRYAGFGRVDAQTPIGHISVHEGDSPHYVPKPEDIASCGKRIEYTIKAFERIPIRYPYLELAMNYYYFAKVAKRLEVKLVNLIIALEALYSTSHLKIKEKLVERASILMSFNFEPDKEHVENLIAQLWEKRCQIIHGRVNQEVTSPDVIVLGRIVQASITHFLAFGLPKREMIRCIMKSTQSEKAHDEMWDLVHENLDKWSF